MEANRPSCTCEVGSSLRVELRPLRRYVRLIVFAICCGVAPGTANAQPSFAAKSLCAAIIPAKAPLPSGIGLPRLAGTTLPISANAIAHHALCRIGVYSPSDGARYNVNWYVFPSHALALSDVNALNVHTIYATVKSKKPAAGFPKPGYLVSGTYVDSGRTESIISVTFVDGPGCRLCLDAGRG